MDHQDSSVTRPYSLVVELVNKAGLRVIKEQKQQRFPAELYEVRMFALQPSWKIIWKMLVAKLSKIYNMSNIKEKSRVEPQQYHTQNKY